MALPDNTYISVSSMVPKECPECGEQTSEFLVANELQFDAAGNFGIEAVVRYDPCGHVDPDADADPVTIAILTDYFETAPKDDDAPEA